MENLKKNEIFEAEIEGYTSEGSGVCRIGGRAVFVPRTIKGELWKLRIVKVTNTAVYGRAEECIKSSAERREPECPDFKRCGGCTLWHMSYEEELNFKLQKVNDALKHIGGQTVQAQSIIGSDSITGYRNKGIYAVRKLDDKCRAGFFAARTHELIPIDRCLIQNKLADRVKASVLGFMDDKKIPAYNEKSGEGAIRHVYVRCAVNTKDAVACIVSSRGLHEHTSALVETLRRDCPELSGIVLNINKTRGNTVLAGEFYTLWGSEIMCDSLGGISYEISPQAFYQINPPQAEKLYTKALEYAATSEQSTVLDMYCGAGTISLYLAGKAGRVIGAEIIPEAVENAKKNADNNGIKNAEFICADASEAAERFLRNGIQPEVVVTDPPRKGMSEEAIKAICGMSPERVVYVSCNPATLARDIAVFNSYGYELKEATAVDMFPRTVHVETVVLMSRAWDETSAVLSVQQKSKKNKEE